MAGFGKLLFWRFGRVSLMVLICLSPAEVGSSPSYDTLPLSLAQKRFAGDEQASALLATVDAFFNSPHLRVADPVLIVDATSRQPVPLVSGDTVYITPVRVMSIAVAAQIGPVQVEKAPLYITHAELDQALAALVKNKLSDLPEELVLLRHVVAGIAPDGFLPADLVAVESIASCAEQAGPMAELILLNATSPDKAAYVLAPENPNFAEALPACLEVVP